MKRPTALVLAVVASCTARIERHARIPMPVRVQLVARAEAPVAVLPLTAVVRAPPGLGEFAVFVVDERAETPVANLRWVELGQSLGSFVQVKSGLNEGEQVVVQGASQLSDGEAVQIIP